MARQDVARFTCGEGGLVQSPGNGGWFLALFFALFALRLFASAPACLGHAGNPTLLDTLCYFARIVPMQSFLSWAHRSLLGGEGPIPRPVYSTDMLLCLLFLPHVEGGLSGPRARRPTAGRSRL